MKSEQQFVVVKFRPTDNRAYTYHNDSQPVQIGDLVKIPDRTGDGWSHATVIEVHHDKPKFETKGIIGKFDPE